ncbi:MAG: 3-hydroxybutyryl-CoA dehydrogenase [Dehalococcoidales bacterium]|nr:3-hydroxybutyryl-CoA dehydrogenase [Dehalococcoidales bacterium]
MPSKKVGVVGCGTMGAGIVQVCAQSGYPVVVSEINQELLNKGLASISTALSRGVERGRLSQEDKDAALGRIKGTTSIKDFADCDLVIEVAIENMEIKKKVFAELDATCPENAILASNTSVLSVTEMAMATRRLDRVVGLHFFNPPPVMQLVEIVRTILVSEETLEFSREFAKSLGKTPVVVPDTPGFIVNRLLLSFILNAIRMLESGVASKEDIDTAITLGLNHPIGPLALADLVGNDIILFMAEGVYQNLSDHQFIAPTLLRRMVSAGQLGRKTGKGFYDYKK